MRSQSRMSGASFIWTLHSRVVCPYPLRTSNVPSLCSCFQDKNSLWIFLRITNLSLKIPPAHLLLTLHQAATSLLSCWTFKLTPEHREGRREKYVTSTTNLANWNTSNTNFSIFIPFGLSGFTRFPSSSTYGTFFTATCSFSKGSNSLAARGERGMAQMGHPGTPVLTSVYPAGAAAQGPSYISGKDRGFLCASPGPKARNHQPQANDRAEVGPIHKREL